MEPMTSPADTRSAQRPCVVIGIDGDLNFATVLQAGARLAALAHAEILVAYVIPAMTADVVVPCGEDDLVEAEAALFADVVDALRDFTGRWQLTTRHGDPAQELLCLARQAHADAIVVGAQTPGWFTHVRRLASPSVAERLARNQRFPLVVVPNTRMPQPA